MTVLRPIPHWSFSMMQQDCSFQDIKVFMTLLFKLFSGLSSSVTEEEPPQDG